MIGNRKLLVAFFAMASASALCWFGKIDPGVYATVMVATGGAYIAGNVLAKRAS